MPLEVARLNEDGVIVGVDAVEEQDHKTDPGARTVRLDGPHDMRNRINSYRWDWSRQTFMPVSSQALDIAELDTPELVEGFVEAFEDTASYFAEVQIAMDTIEKFIDDLNLSPNKVKAKLPKFKLSLRAKRTMAEYRKNKLRRSRGTLP